MNVSPSILGNVFPALQAFVAQVTGLDPSVVIQGIQNRSAIPVASPGFVVMTAVYQRRLRTNVDTWDTTSTHPATISAEQGTELRVQLDCYGAASGDWAAMLSTMLRDEVGCLALAPYSQPLFVEDAKMAPLVDSESQYEQRWTLDAILQYNPVTTVPQQFMGEAAVTLVNVDEAYPP
jgi:hypothetical protein